MVAGRGKTYATTNSTNISSCGSFWLSQREEHRMLGDVLWSIWPYHSALTCPAHALSRWQGAEPWGLYPRRRLEDGAKGEKRDISAPFPSLPGWCPLHGSSPVPPRQPCFGYGSCLGPPALALVFHLLPLSLQPSGSRVSCCC